MTSQASSMSTPAPIPFHSEPRLRDALEDIVDAIHKVLAHGNAAEVMASVQPFIVSFFFFFFHLTHIFGIVDRSA